MRIFIACLLDLFMSALIQKASFGRPMSISRICISFGYQRDNPQDVQWNEVALWERQNSKSQTIKPLYGSRWQMRKTEQELSKKQYDYE